MEERHDLTETYMAAIRDDSAWLRRHFAHIAALRATRRIARTQDCRQVDLLNDDELFDMLQDNDTSDIAPGDQRSFEAADIVIRAEHRETGDTCYIAVEASFTAHEDDIRRATRNANFLARFTGSPAIPVVAAVAIDPKVQADIDSGKVRWYAVEQRDIEQD